MKIDFETIKEERKKTLSTKKEEREKEEKKKQEKKKEFNKSTKKDTKKVMKHLTDLDLNQKILDFVKTSDGNVYAIKLDISLGVKEENMESFCEELTETMNEEYKSDFIRFEFTSNPFALFVRIKK